jgi:hypothetical protein
LGINPCLLGDYLGIIIRSGGFRLVMNPHIKKLSVLFLIAAVATSSLALGISAFIDLASNKDKALQQEGAAYGTTSPDGYRIYGAGPNGQNLTEEVTDIFARQLVAANPDGPIQDEDGSVILLSPTNTELVSYLASNNPSEEILTPPIDDSKMRVVQNFDASDVTHYLSEIMQIQNEISSNPIWRMGISTTTPSDAVSINIADEAGKAFSEARDKAYSIKVPKPLVALHKSQLAFFSTMASFSEVVIRDPAAAMSLSNHLDGIVTSQSADMKLAIEDMQKAFPDILSALPEEDPTGLTGIFGIPVAQAQWVTIDPAHIGTTLLSWAQEAWRQYSDIIISTALGTLKNFLMQKIGQKVITWAEGAGVPGYVTNWVMFEFDAGISAKVGLVNREKAKLCGNAATSGLYGDLLASALGVPTQQVGTTGVNQTVGETDGCPSVSSGFYDNRGYKAEFFLQSLTHNVYGDLITLENRSIRAAGTASQAAVNEALSGRGSLDVKKCDDGSTPGASASDNAEAQDPNFVGPPMPANSRCADGSAARTVTPGSAKQDLISKALGSAQDIIAGVNNERTYAAIAQVLTQAVVNYALKEGAGIFEDSGSSGNPGSTPPPAPGSTIAQQVIWYSGQLELALSLAQAAKADSEQALTTFQQIQRSPAPCADTRAVEIQGYITTIQEFLAAVDGRIQEIQLLVDALNQLKQNPPVSQAQLNAIGSPTTINALVTRSRDDNNAAVAVQNAATDLFRSPECQIPGT